MDSDLGLSLDNLTPAALLGVAILLLLLGKLVPRRTYDDLVADRDHWQQAHADSEKARAEMAAVLEDLLETSRTTEALLKSLPRENGGERA